MKRILWLAAWACFASGAHAIPLGTPSLVESGDTTFGVGLAWYSDTYSADTTFWIDRKLATDPETAWSSLATVSRPTTVEDVNHQLDYSDLSFMFWDMWGASAPAAGAIDNADWDAVLSDPDNWQRAWDLAFGALRGPDGTRLAGALGHGYLDATAVHGSTYDYRVGTGFTEYARTTIRADGRVDDPFLPGLHPRPGVTDLALTKSVDEDTAKPGDSVVFSLSVDNTHGVAATRLEVRDFLGALTPASIVSLSHGSFDTATGIWDVGTLDAGTSALLEYEVLVPLGTLPGTTLENTARIEFYEQYDSSSTNNFAASSVTVVPAPPAAMLFVLAVLGAFAHRAKWRRD